LLRRQARKDLQLHVQRDGGGELYDELRQRLRHDLHREPRIDDLRHHLHGHVPGELQRELLELVDADRLRGLLQCLLQRPLRHDLRDDPGLRLVLDEVRRELRGDVHGRSQHDLSGEVPGV
jgi:hypothetical protein